MDANMTLKQMIDNAEGPIKVIQSKTGCAVYTKDERL